jgi:hypothetical protein
MDNKQTLLLMIQGSIWTIALSAMDKDGPVSQSNHKETEGYHIWYIWYFSC